MISDRLHIDAAMKLAHPEIAATPEVAFVARCFKERDRIARMQMIWLDLLQSGLPYPEWEHDSTWFYMRDVTQYVEISAEIDEEATVKMFARIVKWARARGYGIKKTYEDDKFQLIIDVGDKVSFYFRAAREVMCERVVVGQKTVPARPEEPEQLVDVHEWRCEKLSFLGVETE